MIEPGTLVRWLPDGDLGIVLGPASDTVLGHNNSETYLTIWFLSETAQQLDTTIYVDHPDLEIISELAQPEARRFGPWGVS